MTVISCLPGFHFNSDNYPEGIEYAAAAVYKIPPISKFPETSNISFERTGEYNTASCSPATQQLSVSHGVRSRPSEGESYPYPSGAKPSGKMDMIPLLSPTMESELLKEPWIFPQLQSNIPSTETSTLSFWEENFQDLSNWCGKRPSPTQFHTRYPLQQTCDFPIDEPIAFKQSGGKDNCDNLSTTKGELKEIMGLGEEWTLGRNTHSSGLSTEVSQPTLQQQPFIFNISDVWLNLPSPTIKVEKDKRSINSNFIPIKAEEVLNSNQDFATNTLESWFSVAEEDNTTFNKAVASSNYENMVLDDEYSASFDSVGNQYDKKTTPNDDVLPTFDTRLDTFDLLSYVCDDKISLLHKKPSTDILTSPNATVPKYPTLLQDSIIKSRRTRKISQSRTSSKPYTLPLKVPARNSKAPVNVTTASKSNGKERGKKHYSDDSDSDSLLPEPSYRELRKRNNEASRKSRINKKTKESEMVDLASKLEKDNRILKMKAEELEKLVTSMRTALLQSALKKEA